MWLVRLAIRLARPLARANAFHGRAFVDLDLGDLELVDVRADVVLGIGDGRLQDFFDDRGALLGAEREQIQGLLDVEPTDLVGDQARLLRGDTRVLEFCFSLHVRFLAYLFFFAFLSAACPR
jgi:hypothetical protein